MEGIGDGGDGGGCHVLVEHCSHYFGTFRQVLGLMGTSAEWLLMKSRSNDE